VGLRVERSESDGDVLEHQRLARRLAFNDAIVVGISAGGPGSERQLWGAVYERGSGRPLRRGAITGELALAAARSAEGDPLPRFAEFLCSGRHSREFAVPNGGEVSAGELPVVDTAAADASTTARSAGAIAFAALGLTAVGGGTYFALQASRDPCPGCDGDRSSTWAIALISGGVVSLGVATFLIFEARRVPTSRGRAALGLQPLLRGGVATLGWQF
jgi:hypothetical protein